MSAHDVHVMQQAVLRFLGSLDTEQQAAAMTAFGSPERTKWSYLPGPRPGLPLVAMTSRQQDLALALLDTRCSMAGTCTARGVIELERVRRRLVTGVDELDGDRYWFRVSGEPGEAGPWAWQVNGHHLAVHITVVDNSIAVTPSFLGAEPATVLSGPHRGLRLLVDEEEMGRALLAELAPHQRSMAMTSDVAPDDILTRNDPVADLDRIPRGLPYADMSTLCRSRRQVLEHNGLRQQCSCAAARRTRARVTAAARDLLLAHRYAGTTIRAVATAADVSPETVHKTFGGKAGLLKAVYDVTLAGDDELVPMRDRPQSRALCVARDPAQAATVYAAIAGTIGNRVGPLLRIALSASGSDPDLAAFAEKIDAERLAGARMVVGAWERRGWLRKGGPPTSSGP